MTASIKEWIRPWFNWRRKRFWVLLAVIVYTLAGFFAVPWFLKNTISDTITETGRQIQIEEVQFNPYSLRLRIAGLEIRDTDSTVIAEWGEFVVNVQTSSIFRWALTFKEISISDLHIEEERFALGDTRWTRFIDALSDPDAPPADTSEPSKPPRIIIHEIAIENGGLDVTDQLAGGFHSEFGPITVNASDIRTLPDHSGANEVTIATPDGDVISWRGDLQIVPLASNGQFSIRGNGLPTSLEYADYFLPIGIEGNRLEVDFDYSLSSSPEGISFEATGINTRTGKIEATLDDEESPFVSVEEIALSNGSLRWPERTVNVDSLVIDGLDLSTILDGNGELNLLKAVPQSDGSEEETAADTANTEGLPEWGIEIERFAMPGGRVTLEDQSIGSTGRLVVDDIALNLDGVSNAPDTSMASSLSFNVESGGQFSFDGNVVALPTPNLDGRMSVTELALPAIQPWLEEVARVRLNSGTTSLGATVQGEPPLDLQVTGNFVVNQVEILDTVRDQRLAGLDALNIERFDLNLAERTVETSTVSVSGAFGRVHIYEDLTTNISGLVIESDEPPEEEPAPETEQSAMKMTIAGIELIDSSMDFADDSLPLPFRTLISDLNGELTTLSTETTEPTQVELAGQVDEFGDARIAGELNPWDFTQASDIDMTFRNLEMSNLTPYTVQYAGYAIESGRMDLDLGYSIQNRELIGENNVVIRELVLGDKVEHPDAASLPLKLAVALLKDADGVIDLDLPVSGNLDDPTFEIGAVVWKAIGNLITRIVSSPFRFLGNLIGIDSEDFGTLRFAAGRSEVSPPDREQLINLAKAMQERPELDLSVGGVYVSELDVPALKTLKLDEQLETTQTALLESNQADVLDAERPALELLFTEAFPARPLETIQAEFTAVPPQDEEAAPAELDVPAYLAELRRNLIEAQEISDSDLQTLARSRAEAIIAVLTGASETGEVRAALADNKAGEAEEDEILLELEVAVNEPEPDQE